MAILKILYIPDPRLREQAKTVIVFDDSLQKLIDDMIETMYDANGVGVAATQVGIAKRVSVIDRSRRDGKDILVLINPEILEKRDMVEMEEGCLSVPGHYDTLKRANWVKMRAQDRHGEEYELEAEGFLAEAIQHEIDHLNGKVYIDYLSSLKRKRILEKVKKIKRQMKEQQY